MNHIGEEEGLNNSRIENQNVVRCNERGRGSGGCRTNVRRSLDDTVVTPTPTQTTFFICFFHIVQQTGIGFQRLDYLGNISGTYRKIHTADRSGRGSIFRRTMASTTGFSCVHISGLPKASAEVLSDSDYERAFVGWLQQSDESEQSNGSTNKTQTTSASALPFVSLKVVRDRETSVCRGYAFLSFFQRLEAERCIRIFASEEGGCVGNGSTASFAAEGEISVDLPCQETIDLWRSLSKNGPPGAVSSNLPRVVAQFAVEKKARKTERTKEEGQHLLSHIRIGRRKFASKPKHPESTTCSDKSKIVMDSKGFMTYKMKK